MKGHPVFYRTDLCSEGCGVVIAFDPATERLKVRDDEDGSTWAGSLEHIEEREGVVFFDATAGQIHASAVRGPAGDWLANGKTLTELQNDYPGMTLRCLDDL